MEIRETANAKIRSSIDQLDRGEGIPEDQLDAYLAKLNSQKSCMVAQSLQCKVVLFSAVKIEEELFALARV